MWTLLTGLSGVQRNLLLVLAAVIVLLLAGLGATVWLVLDLQEQNGALRVQSAQQLQTIQDLNTQVTDLRKESARIDFILVEKDRALNQLRKTAKRQQEELIAHAKVSPEVQEWADSTVPASVVDRLLAIPTDNPKNTD